MNVIKFPTPTSYLSAERDGFYVLFSFGDTPVEANGPFSTVAEARAWPTENGARERVRVDRSTFPGGSA